MTATASPPWTRAGNFIRIDTAAESELYLGVGGSAVDADGNFTFFTSDPGNEKFFTLGFSNNQYRFGQPGFYYEELKRNVTQLKADLTHQYNFNHQLKTGLLYRRHTLDQFQQRTQVKVIYDPNFPFETTAYTLNPVETALYVQDKIEYEGVIVNAGVRLDMFNPGAQVLADFLQSLDAGHPGQRPDHPQGAPSATTPTPRCSCSRGSAYPTRSPRRRPCTTRGAGSTRRRPSRSSTTNTAPSPTRRCRTCAT